MNTLQQQDIGVAIYYQTPMHQQPCFAALGYKPGDFPHTENAAAQTLALPIYPELTQAMLHEIVEAVQTMQVMD